MLQGGLGLGLFVRRKFLEESKKLTLRFKFHVSGFAVELCHKVV